MKKLILLSVSLLFIINASAQTVPAKDALKHTGKKVTICDKVYGIKLDDNSKKITLYLGGDYPHQLVTVIAVGDDKVNAKNRSEADYKGKDICVTGIIVDNKGKAQITVKDTKQVRYILIDGPVKQKF